jgi:hypothetical protein
MLELELADRSPKSPEETKPTLKGSASVALTQEGERSQAEIADASKQRVRELRALMREKKRVKKAL